MSPARSTLSSLAVTLALLSAQLTPTDALGSILGQLAPTLPSTTLQYQVAPNPCDGLNNCTPLEPTPGTYQQASPNLPTQLQGNGAYVGNPPAATIDPAATICPANPGYYPDPNCLNTISGYNAPAQGGYTSSSDTSADLNSISAVDGLRADGSNANDSLGLTPTPTPTNNYYASKVPSPIDGSSADSKCTGASPCTVNGDQTSAKQSQTSGSAGMSHHDFEVMADSSSGVASNAGILNPNESPTVAVVYDNPATGPFPDVGALPFHSPASTVKSHYTVTALAGAVALLAACTL